jgi:hypothetical protein
MYLYVNIHMYTYVRPFPLLIFLCVWLKNIEIKIIRILRMSFFGLKFSRMNIGFPFSHFWMEQSEMEGHQQKSGTVQWAATLWELGGKNSKQMKRRKKIVKRNYFIPQKQGDQIGRIFAYWQSVDILWTVFWQLLK